MSILLFLCEDVFLSPLCHVLTQDTMWLFRKPHQHLVSFRRFHLIWEVRKKERVQNWPDIASGYVSCCHSSHCFQVVMYTYPIWFISYLYFNRSATQSPPYNCIPTLFFFIQIHIHQHKKCAHSRCARACLCICHILSTKMCILLAKIRTFFGREDISTCPYSSKGLFEGYDEVLRLELELFFG